MKKSRLERKFEKQTALEIKAARRREKAEESAKKAATRVYVVGFKKAFNEHFANFKKLVRVRFVPTKFNNYPIHAEFSFNGELFKISYIEDKHVSHGIDDWGFDLWCWELSRGSNNDSMTIHSRQCYSEFTTPWGWTESDKNPGDLSEELERCLKALYYKTPRSRSAFRY